MTRAISTQCDFARSALVLARALCFMLGMAALECTSAGDIEYSPTPLCRESFWRSWMPTRSTESVELRLVGFPGRRADFSPNEFEFFGPVYLNSEISFVPARPGRAPAKLNSLEALTTSPVTQQQAKVVIPGTLLRDDDNPIANLEFRQRSGPDQPFELKALVTLDWGHASVAEVQPLFPLFDSGNAGEGPEQYRLRVVFQECVPLQLSIRIDGQYTPFTVEPELLLPAPRPSVIISIPRASFAGTPGGLPHPLRLVLSASGTPPRTFEILLGAPLSVVSPLRPNRIELDDVKGTYSINVDYEGGRGVKRVWAALAKDLKWLSVGTEAVQWSIQGSTSAGTQGTSTIRNTLTTEIPVNFVTRTLSFTPSALWLAVEDNNEHVTYVRLPVVKSSPQMRESARLLEDSMNRFGGDYQSLSVATEISCMNACRNALAGQCKAWTFVRAGAPGGGPRCWLKDQVPPATVDGCCTSGVLPANASAPFDKARRRTVP